VSDHRTYPAAERVVTAMDGDGLTLRVYENSRTVCTEAVLSQDEAHRLAQRLVNWSLRHGPWTLSEDEPESVAQEPKGPVMPANWPPKPGEQWRDVKDDVWFVMGAGKLVCLADDLNEADGFGPTPREAIKVHESCGPLHRAMAALDAEVPW
jgi:hypothetical protein